MPPPVRQFLPTPGIAVDVVDQNITISGRAEVWGANATPAVAQTIQATINRVWSKTFPDGYTSLCTVTVTYRAPNTPATEVLQIQFETMKGISNAVRGNQGKVSRIQLNTIDSNELTWVVAHEFGHVMGLKDRYKESSDSRSSGDNGGARTTTIDPGYEGSLMAQDEGQNSSQTIKDLNAETAPSWTEEDDQTVAWLRSHTPGDIRALPTATKLAAIRTMMDGWISEADVAGMEKIILTVQNPAEARALRGGMNLSDFTSIGQRTRIRVAFSRVAR